MNNLSLLRFCGVHPYLIPKEKALLQRGLLKPLVWGSVHILVADPCAVVTGVAGFDSRRVEVVSNGVTVVLADFLGSGLPVVVTAFAAHDPVDHGAAILTAARRVRAFDLVDLDARLDGAA